MGQIITKYLPLWILACSGIAYVYPEPFRDWQGLTAPSLAFILFAMGISLPTESIVAVLKRPKVMLLGVTWKWTITLAISIMIALLFFPDHTEMATGIILAGAVPSGTSANLYTFIAEGTTALSITMSAMDTFVGPVLTPVIMKAAAGKYVHVEFVPLFLKLIYIVLLPISLGLFIQWKWGGYVRRIRAAIPVLSAFCLFIVVLAVVSNSQEMLQQNLHLLPLLTLAVVLQVTLPMLAGYALARLFRFAEGDCRAIMFETGNCNTALAALLAIDHFSAGTAVPAVANVVANLSIGAFVAMSLAKRSRKQHSSKVSPIS